MAFYKFQKDYLTFKFVLKHLFNLKHTCSTLYTIVYSQLIFRPKQKKEQLFTGLSFSFFPTNLRHFLEFNNQQLAFARKCNESGGKGERGKCFGMRPRRLIGSDQRTKTGERRGSQQNDDESAKVQWKPHLKQNTTSSNCFYFSGHFCGEKNFLVFSKKRCYFWINQKCY